MPALGMAQETGKILRWLKTEGASVTKGEPIMEIETDKITVEIEANDSGILAQITACEGDAVPVGQTVAWILAPGESAPSAALAVQPSSAPIKSADFDVTPVARRLAEEHGIDLALVKSGGGRIEKADVLAYLQSNPASRLTPLPANKGSRSGKSEARIPAASPKARRLALERGIDLAALHGSGPGGAVLATDILNASSVAGPPPDTLSTAWRVMAERMTQSWTTVPHFYLMRDISASGLVELRAQLAPTVEKRHGVRPTYTDLLVKIVGMVLRDHPRVNASWADGTIRWSESINIGLATAIQNGLIVPVIHDADKLSIGEVAAQRHALVERANAGKLRPADIAGGTFTLTNLGMYNVDVFSAIINAPQAAILAVGRIADRVVPVDGQPAVRPMMTISLSCDHRVVDGARAAKFLDDLANLIQEPWGILA